MFGNLSDRLSDTFKNLRGKGRLSDSDIDATLRDIRRALLEADVALEVVKDFIAAIRERALGDEVSKALNPAQQVVQIVNEELTKILGSENHKLQFAKSPPTVIMLAGLQGSGKTTLAGKLAKWLKDQNQTPILVAADLQRPNAVTQLQVLGEKVGVPVFSPEPGNGVGDPVDVAKKAIAHAKKSQFSVVIVDTAGRLGVDEEMMQQAIGIRDAVSPDEVLFVVDSMLGQDAVNVAKAFKDGPQKPGYMNHGNAPAKMATAAKKVTADYSYPILAHAALEPINATAHVTGDKAELWLSTQTPEDARRMVALALGPTAGLGAARVVASHYSIMVKGLSQLFAAGPAVAAAIGDTLDREQLGGVEVDCFAVELDLGFGAARADLQADAAVEHQGHLVAHGLIDRRQHVER